MLRGVTDRYRFETTCATWLTKLYCTCLSYVVVHGKGYVVAVKTNKTILLCLQWNKVSTAQLSILEHQMDPTSNFTSYRSTLKVKPNTLIIVMD